MVWKYAIQNMPLWHIDYFKPKAIEQTQENLKKQGTNFPFVKEISICRDLYLQRTPGMAEVANGKAFALTGSIHFEKQAEWFWCTQCF